MKAYHSNNPKTKNYKTAIISLAVCGVLVAVSVALALGLSLRQKDVPVEPVVNNPITYTMPIAGAEAGQEFSVDKLVYNKTLNQWRTHNGVDFACNKGAEVLAIYDGTVTKVEVTTLEGTVVEIDHGEGLVATYKGLENVTLNKGDKVTSGQKIGEIGTMMTESLEGYHLHLEMTLNGKFVNPMDYLPSSQEK
ncbi:MAG: M23 family metallopeptidase [Clostridia bacterium]|nr:M23 family metallopeptidase [Clostridia bacterium]